MQAQPKSNRYRDILTDYLEAIERHGRAFIHPKSGLNLAAINALIDTANRMTTLAAQHGDTQLADLGRQLGNQAKGYTHQIGRPVSAEQHARLKTLIGLLHTTITGTENTNVKVHNTDAMSLPRSEEILLIGPQTAAVTDPLRYAGLQVRYLATLEEGEKALSQSQPPAAVIQADVAPKNQQALTGIEMIKSLRRRVEITTPILFVAENSDFNSRLAAVQAGGIGYFTLPLDTMGMAEKLNKLLRDRHQNAQAQAQGQVLLISDQAESGKPLSTLLQNLQINVELLDNANKTIDLLNRFQPDLIVLDLDIKNIDSLELVKVLRQHENCYALPILLLCQADRRDYYLARLQGYSDDLLCKPIDDKYLTWLVKRRLLRNRAVTGKLRDLRNCDSISGLYNRSYILTQLELALAAQNNPGDRLAVMQIALDDIATGTEAAATLSNDDLMAAAGNHLREHLADQFPVARFADHRFVALINPAFSEHKLLEFARKLKKSLQNVRCQIGNESITLNVRIGIGVTSSTTGDLPTLLYNTEHAVELARKSDDRIQLYSPAREPNSESSDKQAFLEDIIEAVKHGNLRLLYHPIMNLEDSKRRYEVLLRIDNGQGQDWLSETVFGAIQQHRLGLYLDRWVVTRCLIEMRKLQDYVATTTLFVNLSAITLEDQSFPTWLEQQLQKALLPARLLVFEIGEDFARLYPDICKELGDRLRKLGCGFALERFGSHPDSIAVLQSLQFNYVKLDRKLVKTLQGSQANAGKRRLNDIAAKLNNLDTAIIATGIENIDLLPILWSSGVKYVQGHILRRPQEKMNFNFILEEL